MPDIATSASPRSSRTVDDAPEATTASPASDPVRDLAAAMARFRRIAPVGAGRVAEDVGLSPGQLAALLAIEEGGKGVSAVADQCFTHLSNASRTVDSLVREGLVDRSRDPQDGRAVVLTATTEGRAVLAHTQDGLADLMHAALGDMGVEDQVALVRLLTRLVEGLETALHEQAA